MAIVSMIKVMVICHRSYASELLEALQREGICQILNADEAMVSKDMPELKTQGQRSKDIETLINRLQKCIGFLNNFSQAKKGLAGILSPRTVIDEESYQKVITDQQILKIIDECEQTESTIEKTKAQIENLDTTLEMLAPWKDLQTPVEELGQLKTTTCFTGLITPRHLEQLTEDTIELGAAVEQIGTDVNKIPCLIVCLKEQIDQVQKLLRSAEFEPVSFESMTGTVAELIQQYSEKLDQAGTHLHNHYEKAAVLSESLVKLEILYDYYENLLNREQTKNTTPATQHTVILEGWVKKKDFQKLEKIVSDFEAASVTKIQPAENEKPPVEIENRKPWRPFEVITRLYGMPQHFEVDPTVFLAPFFALFFGLCLTDAGYGLIMVALSIFLLKKLQGDKKFATMMVICSVSTIVCGALTGGWFGDAVQILGIPVLIKARTAILKFGFDPAKNPKIFFRLALAIGYVQLLSGILVAFFYKLRQRRFIEALCSHLTWFVMLNCIAAYYFSTKQILVPEKYGNFFLRFAIIPAVLIVLFSHNEGGIVARLGMGFFNLFSSIFYIGDILSYVRLMALGMVTAGLAVAINRFGVMASEIKYVGPVLAALVLVGGHLFNIGISALGAFVHTLRLQYVEFFPKFFEGGGKLFEPFTKQHQHIYIIKN